MSKYKINELADEISIRENNPKNSDYDKFVGLEHYDSGNILIKRYGTTEKLDSAMKVFKNDDILIARRNVYLKRASMVKFDGLTSGDSIVLRARNESIKKLLPFVFNTEQFWNYAISHADGSMSKRLSPALLMEYETNLPDNDKDRDKLADVLWSINDTLDSYKDQLRLCDELVKAQFVEMFGDENRVKLGDYIEQIRGVSYKPSDLGFEEDENHVALLRANNIINNEIVFNDMQYVSRKKVSEWQYLKNGDIVMCGSSGSKEHVGKAAIFNGNGNYTFGAFCKVVRASKGLSNLYIAEYFKTDEYREYIRKISAGSNINNLRNEHIDDILIPFPKEKKIQEFVNFANHLDKSKVALKDSIDLLNKIYTNIINTNLG